MSHAGPQERRSISSSAAGGAVIGTRPLPDAAACRLGALARISRPYQSFLEEVIEVM